MAQFMFGVDGEFTVKVGKPGLFKEQTFTAVRNLEAGDYLKVKMRFDDSCGNGHNSFYITGETFDTSGSIHAKIAEVFPEFAHLMKWHGCSTDGPTHYIDNTVYHASNLEKGKAVGDPSAWRKGYEFGNSPVTWYPHYSHTSFIDWLEANKHLPMKVVALHHVKEVVTEFNYEPKYTFETANGTYGSKWHHGPFDTLAEACEVASAFAMGMGKLRNQVTAYSKGKERDLDAARRCAIWPHATDEQLCLPEEELTNLLEARLPDLLEAFKADMLACNFMWEAV